MVLDIIIAAIGLLMIFFIPGFTFIRALFPRKEDLDPEYGLLYQIALGMAMSIVLTILVGIFLASLGTNPATGKGYFDAPYLWVSLITISCVFFFVGWYRGGYPILGKVHPSLLRYPKVSIAGKVRREDMNRYIELTGKKEVLMKRLKDTERRILLADMKMKDHYESLRARTISEIEVIEKEINALMHGNEPEVRRDYDK